MKKINIFILIFSIFFTFVPHASAFDISISPDGTMQFYAGSVLGEQNTVGIQKEDVKKYEEKSEQRNKQEKRESVRTVSPREKKELHIVPKETRVEIELKDKTNNAQDSHDTKEKERFIKTEKMETRDLQIEVPVVQYEDDKEAAVKIEEKIEDGNYSKEEKQRMKSILEEKQTRKEEKLRIRNRMENGQQRLELESRNVEAKLERGAEFTVDPKTNIVTITTPSGKEHVLNHLPDQAIGRMQNAGLLHSFSGEIKRDIIVETNERGDLVYKAEEVEEKKFLGLFKRKIEKEIVLNDRSGEITEQDMSHVSFFGRIINRLSF